MAASQRTNPASISPKVKAAGWWGIALTLLGAGLAAITPDMLVALGVWAGPVYGVITAAAMLVAAYRKNDPARWDLTLNAPDEQGQVFLPVDPEILEPTPAANEVRVEYPEEDDTPGKHVAE